MASKKAKSKKSKGSRGKAASKLGGAIINAATKSKKGEEKKRRSKSPAWYARKIATLKLKRRYDKLRLSV